MYFRPNRLAALLVVEEHHVANVIVEDREERFQGDPSLHLLAMVNDQDERVLLVEATATREGHRSHGQTSRGATSAVFVSIWIDICQAKWRYGSNKSGCRMDGCTVFERFPFNNALGHVGKDVCTGEPPVARATRSECRREKKASTRQAVKRRGGERAAITRWPRESEPGCLLH